MTKDEFFKDFETEFDAKSEKPFSDKLMFEMASLIHEDQFTPEETFKFCKDMQTTINSIAKMDADKREDTVNAIKKIVIDKTRNF